MSDGQFFSKEKFYEKGNPFQIGQTKLSYKKDSKEIYCFVEGWGDHSFYTNFINTYFADYSIKWIKNEIGGVSEVLKSFETAKDQSKNWTAMCKNRFLFFTDKDCSDLFPENELRELKKGNENIFETKEAYSFENYLVENYIVERILKDFFGLNDHEVSELATKQFEKIYKDFFNYLSNIVCLDIESRDKQGIVKSLLNKKNEGKEKKDKIGFKNIVNIENLFELKFDEKKKSFDLSMKKNTINQILGNLKLSDEQYQKIVDERKNHLSNGGFKKYCRGHFEIQILVLFFSVIMNKLKLNNDIFKKMPVKKGENFSEEFVVTLAAPRAKIPTELKEFLEENYKNLIEGNKKRGTIS